MVLSLIAVLLSVLLVVVGSGILNCLDNGLVFLISIGIGNDTGIGN